MPTNEQLTRLGIFVATGYLCAGILVSIFAGLSYWVSFFGSEFFIAAIAVCALVVVGAAIGICLMRYLVPRYGVKNIFEQDVLILMIGLLFIALTMNQAMLVVGLLVTSGAMAVYFFENFAVQTKAASDGGVRTLTLAGWALGPIVSVALLTIFGDYGLITLRVIFAHYIVIAFWVWVQRLGLHMDYQDAPQSILRLVASHQASAAKAKQQDEYNKKTRHGSLAVEAPKAQAVKSAAPAAAPKAAPAAPAAQAAPAAPKTEPVKAEPAKTEAPAAPAVAPAAAPKAETPAAPKAEVAATKADAPAPKAETPEVKTEAKPAAPAAPVTATAPASPADAADAADAATEAKAETKAPAESATKKEEPKKKKGFFGLL